MPIEGQDKIANTTKTFSVAGVTFPDTILGGIIQAEIKMTAVKGTVMDFMTTATDWGGQDAQRMELIGRSLLSQNGTTAPIGINMVNFDAV
jgi:hypothetical protein